LKRPRKGARARLPPVATSAGSASLPPLRSFTEKGRITVKKWLAPITFALALGLGFTSLGEVQAAGECKSDSDCAAGTYCILALTPPVCKAPQAAGAPCKRDVVCASKKCDIPAGKEAGACK
jgi:hypothetical protein